MPSCLACEKHFKLSKFIAEDDPDNQYCLDCSVSTISTEYNLSLDDSLDIDILVNPSGRTPARYNE